MNEFARFAVPPGVVMPTLCAPAEPAGVTAVTVVSFTTVTSVAKAPPTVTLTAPVRFDPVNVMAVPPLVSPVLGATDVSAGEATPAILATRNPT